MKKLFALTLALVLCLSLTACSGSLSLGRPTAPASEAPAQSTAPTEPKTEAPTESAKPEGIHGIIEGNTYTNDALNFKFTLPEGWIYYTDEQMAAQNNLSVEMFKDTDTAEAIKTAGQLMDMMATKSDGSNVNLVIQPAQVQMSTFTDKQLFDLLQENYKAQFASSGLEIKEYGTVDLPALGKDRSALRMVIEMSGVEMIEHQIWLRDGTDCYGVLTITSLDGSGIEELISGISTAH